MRRTLGLCSAVLVVLVILTGCSLGTKVSPLASPLTSPLAQLAPVPDSRKDTALEAYPFALARAQQWNPEVVLHGVMPTIQMARNLGLPAVIDGWFFMFKVPGSPVEFYVQIAEGSVLGYTEAQPIMGDQLPYQYDTIDVNQVKLDSRDVLEKFSRTKREVPAGAALDYRLVRLEGQEQPVWTLLAISDTEITSLLHLDAVTGEEVGDPFE